MGMSGMVPVVTETDKLSDLVLTETMMNDDMTILSISPRKSGPKMVSLAKTDSTKENTGPMVVTVSSSETDQCPKWEKVPQLMLLITVAKPTKIAKNVSEKSTVTLVSVNLSDTPGNGQPKKTDSSPVMKKEHANANFTNVTS